MKRSEILKKLEHLNKDDLGIINTALDYYEERFNQTKEYLEDTISSSKEALKISNKAATDLY